MTFVDVLTRRGRFHGRSGSGSSDLHRRVSREVRFEEAAGALGKDSMRWCYKYCVLTMHGCHLWCKVLRIFGKRIA